jgi:hypothetical protein
MSGDPFPGWYPTWPWYPSTWPMYFPVYQPMPISPCTPWRFCPWCGKEVATAHECEKG